MTRNRNISAARNGFSLAEVLAAMMIGSMVLIAVLTVYTRAERTAAALTNNLGNSKLPYEVLQLIAEDFDKILSTDSDCDAIIVNRHINDYAAPLFAMRQYYKDSTNKNQESKEIVWQCNANSDSDANDMVLYRSYESIAPQDKLLDEHKEALEKNAYVPICRGVTYFRVEILNGKDDAQAGWPGGMPTGAIFKISFAKPYKNAEGQYEVPENEIYQRTVAFDKSRNIKFNIPKDDSSEDVNDVTDVNAQGKEDISDNEVTPAKKIQLLKK